MSKKRFREQQNGYHKGQVDKYIRELQEAYQKVYMSYLELSEKYPEKSNRKQNSNYRAHHDNHLTFIETNEIVG